MGASDGLLRPVREVISRLRHYQPLRQPREDTYEERDPWKFLRNLDAVPQRAVIAGYLQHLLPTGRVLDVGCGEGLIMPHIGPGIRYTGLDLSAAAIARAKEQYGDRGDFIAADATTYKPDGQFDAIVFNESIYYMTDPANVIRGYQPFVADGGYLIISMYEQPTTMRAWREIGALGEPRDRVTLKRPGGNTWEIRVY